LKGIEIDERKLKEVMGKISKYNIYSMYSRIFNLVYYKFAMSLTKEVFNRKGKADGKK